MYDTSADEIQLTPEGENPYMPNMPETPQLEALEVEGPPAGIPEPSPAPPEAARAANGAGTDGNVGIDFDAINAPLEMGEEDMSEREKEARERVEAIQTEVAERLREFQAMVARFGRNHDYILHQPDGSTRACRSRELENLAGRGTVQPADYIRNRTTGETVLAIDVPWLRAILVARRHNKFGSQSKYQRRKKRQQTILLVVANLVLFGGVGAGLAFADLTVLF